MAPGKRDKVAPKQTLRGGHGPRVFKTSHFTKLAKGAGIGDDELCEAARALFKGQGDALGGSVWKKRLDKNRHRSIVIAKASEFWIFVYLFAKKDRENIEADELAGFKRLAKDYGVNPGRLAGMLENGDLKEICDDYEGE